MPIPYRKILVPLDGSALAEGIFRHLQPFIEPTHTEFVLVNVFEAWRYPIRLNFAILEFLAEMRTSAEKYLADQCGQLRTLGYRVEACFLEGEAAQCILDTAKTTGVDLIAMTTHGYSGFTYWALGSVAERVIHDALTPIFLVRDMSNPPNNKFQRILAPLDGSALAEQALPQVAMLAQATGAQVLLLEVIPILDAQSQPLLFNSEESAQVAFAQWRAGAEQYLGQVMQRLHTQGITSDFRVAYGVPAEIISKTVTDEQIDLIVMSTHGRSGLNRWMYGSVTNRVLRSAICPLLLVRSVQPEFHSI